MKIRENNFLFLSLFFVIFFKGILSIASNKLPLKEDKNGPCGIDFTTYHEKYYNYFDFGRAWQDEIDNASDLKHIKISLCLLKGSIELDHSWNFRKNEIQKSGQKAIQNGSAPIDSNPLLVGNLRIRKYGMHFVFDYNPIRHLYEICSLFNDVDPVQELCSDPLIKDNIPAIE